MYSRFHLVKKYLHYYFTASNTKGHGTHSPFVFNFIKNILNDREDYFAYQQVEKLRKQLLRDHSILTVEDLGAGSTISKVDRRKVSDIARYAAKPKKYG